MDHITTYTNTYVPYMSPHAIPHAENQSTHSSQRNTPTTTNELHSLESTTAHYDHPFLSELYEPSFAAPIIVANATYRPHSLPLSHTIPHIRFPIGTGDPNNDATLCAMIDSGAGCNLGRKSYHLSIYEKFPKLIQAVESQVNQAEWQDVNIGHIHETGQPVVISAVIVYKTPYIIDGHPVTIRIGLADHTAINTIFGITFLRSSESVVFFGGSTKNKDQLVSTRLGITLPIYMQPPASNDEAPDYDQRSSAAFVSKIKPVAASGFLVSPDTTALIGPHIADQQPDDGDDFLICKLE